MDLWDFCLAKLLRRLLLQFLKIGRDDRFLNLARDVFYLKVNNKTVSPLNFRLAEVTKAKLFAEFNYNFKCPEDISSQKLNVKADFFLPQKALSSRIYAFTQAFHFINVKN